MTALRRRSAVRAVPALDPGRFLAGAAVLLAAASLGLLVLRLPLLLTQLDTSGYVSSAWVLATVVGTGHTGPVVLGTQGAFLPLLAGVLTRGLPDHRIVWELSPLVLSLAWIALLAATVGRLGGRRAGLTCALVLCVCAPELRSILLEPWMHNTTFVGAALLDAWVVWWQLTGRSGRAVLLVTVAAGLLAGCLVACDTMLAVVGLVPLVVVATVAWRAGSRSLAGAVAVLGTCAALGALVTWVVALSLRLSSTALPLRLDAGLLAVRLGWIATGLLRLGGGLPGASAPVVEIVLGVLAGTATVAGLGLVLRLGAGALVDPGDGRDLARSLHVVFWAAVLVCSILAYLLTVVVPSDRYLALAAPAVAACVPLVVARGPIRPPAAVALGGYLLSGLVSLALLTPATAGDRALLAPRADRLAAFVAARRLRVGYAGYWTAAPLDWASGMRLSLHPVVDAQDGRLRPSAVAAAADWYRDRPGPSFLVLEPHDGTLADGVPEGFPRPARVYHVGPATILAYRGDIARLLVDRPAGA